MDAYNFLEENYRNMLFDQGEIYFGSDLMCKIMEDYAQQKLTIASVSGKRPDDGFKYMCSDCGSGYDCVECGCQRCDNACASGAVDTGAAGGICNHPQEQLKK